MPSFFDDPQDQPTVPVVPETPQSVKVGEKEYSMDELSKLVSLGEMGREVETRYNTKLDRVYPAFTKTTQELKELREKFEQQEQKPVDYNDEIAIRQARDAAKKVGLVTNDDIKEYIRAEMPNYYREQRETEKVLETAKNLEGKYTGADGRPAFKTEDMLGFMRDSGITDAETAYKVRYEKEIDSWKEQQLSRAKKSDVFTNSGITNPKQPSDPVPTKENLQQLIRETLYGNSDSGN